MAVAPMVVVAAPVIEVMTMGFGDARKRDGGNDGGDGSECKLFHGDVPFGLVELCFHCRSPFGFVFSE
jgi:hypothetical protein